MKFLGHQVDTVFVCNETIHIHHLQSVERNGEILNHNLGTGFGAFLPGNNACFEPCAGQALFDLFT